MGLEPKVTGLSPVTGPPGTKITVRGENLGQSKEDIIKLTINGADCLPYLEWDSPKKIVTRCTRAFGDGDVILTTNSGGPGTCDVQFKCYEKPVGLTEESAVWVDEIDTQQGEKEKTVPCGDEYSLEVSSARFNPHIYILHNCSNYSLRELQQLQKNLKLDLASKNDPEIMTSSNRAAMLKSNLPVIMECLQILEHLSKVVNTSKDSSIDSAAKSIKDSLAKTHDIFDPLLAQKDLVQSIESAMQVFKQNETLFNLPTAIETSIKTRNYDSVVKEISIVLSRLKTIEADQNITEKIQSDLMSKVNKLKETIRSQLQQSCHCTNGERNIDEVRRLVSHLNRLGEPIEFDVWSAVKEMVDSLITTMSDKYSHYLKLGIEQSNPSESVKVVQNGRSPTQKGEPPFTVKFVQNALTLFHNTYYDILTLGQSYFDYKDEFACKDPGDLRQSKLEEFEEVMVVKPINHLCLLLRLVLVPESARLDKPSEWPSSSTGDLVDWIQHILQSVITCHIHLTKVNLPPLARNSVEDFREFVFELRVRFMQILFTNATKLNKSLHHREDWMIEVDDTYGGRTKLPLVFENNVVETLRFANDTIFKANFVDDRSILKRVDVQASMKELAHGLINSFIDSLENALIDSKEHPAETTRILIASRDSKCVPSEYMNRLLITISNCQFTKDLVFGRLQNEFEKLQGLKMDRVFKVCGKKYCDYIYKISQKFCRVKCTELNKLLKEPSLNDTNLQLNLMIVNSQIFLIAPQLVNSLMTTIVNAMQRDKTDEI